MTSFRPVLVRFTVMLALVWMSGSAKAQSADTLTVDLQGVILRVVQTSPDILAERAGVDYAESRSSLARASRLVPEFTATSAHAAAPGINNPNSAPNGALYLDPEVRNDWEEIRPFNRLEIQAVQPLWTWGELGGSIRAADHAVGLERAVVRAKELEVAERSGELYFSVVLTDALARLTAEARDVVQQAKNEIRLLLDEGAEDVDDADEYQVLITEQEFQRRVVEVEQQQYIAQTALRRQLLLPDGVVVEPADQVLEPLRMQVDSLAFYLDAALSNRPELEQALEGISARSALVDVARSDFYPKVFAGVRAKYSGAAGRYRQRNPYVGDPFLSRSVEVGLGMEMNLNMLQTRARVEQAQAELSEARYLEEGAVQLVLFEVEEAFRNVLIRRSTMTASEEALRLSKDWLRLEQINFDLELGDTENLVKAVRANLLLQAERHQAVYDYNVSLIRLLRRSGMLDRSELLGTQVD